jgi:hypothetical protein
VIANYLPVKNQCTYMYITGSLANGGQDYGTLHDPLRFCHGSKLDDQWEWSTREIPGALFSGGPALVNPYLKRVTVTLPPGSYVDVNGNPVGSTVTMAKRTGLVLLNAP